MKLRGAHRHTRLIKEPQIERPSRSVALRERLNSPWLVIGQYIFNIVLVVLILWLTSNQNELQKTQQEYSDYLAGKGAQRDAERAQDERDRAERAQNTQRVLCDLIARLESDLGQDLPGMRDAASCPDETPGSLPGATRKLVPIVPGGGTSTAPPTPGSHSTTGDPGAGNGGRESSPTTGPSSGGGASPTTPGADKPAPPPPADGDRGGLVEGIDLCAPFLGCVL